MQNFLHALVYYTKDKTVGTCKVKDILGWSEDTLDRLRRKEQVMMTVVDEDQKMIKVRVLQVASAQADLVETGRFVAAMKAKGRKMDDLVIHFQAIRDGSRQKLPPLSNYYTETDESEAPPEKASRLERSNIGTPSERENFPPMDVSFGASGPSVLQTSAIRSSSPIPPRTKKRNATKAMYDKMMATCRELNIEPDSHHATLFFIASLTQQSCETNARLKKVEEDIDVLKKALVRSGTSDLAGPSFPIFSDPAEYEAAGNDPGKLESWIHSEGGDNMRQFVHRVMVKLLAPDLQLRINRPGSHDKMRFHKCLEIVITNAATKLYPGCTCSEVEKAIGRFFNNARDRNGGRSERRVSTKENIASRKRTRDNLIMTADAQIE